MRGAAALAGLALAGAAVVGCGGGGTSPLQAWRDQCTTAAQRLAALPPTGSADLLGLAAGAAGVNLRDLSAAVDGLPDPGDAAATANLRGGVLAVAVGFGDVAASLRGTGTGGRERVVRDAAAAYGRVETSARALGLPECGADALGRARFTAYARASRGAVAAEPLAALMRRSCDRLRLAYGYSAPPADRGAALAQFRRSIDVLGDVARETRARPEPRARRLAAAATDAVGMLVAARRRVLGGAQPSITVRAAFRRTDARLRDAIPAGCISQG